MAPPTPGGYAPGMQTYESPRVVRRTVVDPMLVGAASDPGSFSAPS